jgi:hypothetical protein
MDFRIEDVALKAEEDISVAGADVSDGRCNAAQRYHARLAILAVAEVPRQEQCPSIRVEWLVRRLIDSVKFNINI